MAHTTVLTPGIPLAYTSQAVLEPRRAFEYSSSVHTADYSNYASVKSDNAGLVASAPVTQVLTEAVPAVRTVEVHSAPLVQSHLIASHPTPLISYRNSIPVYAHAPAILAPQTYAVQYTQQLVQPAHQQFLVKSEVAPEVHVVETQPEEPKAEVKETITELREAVAEPETIVVATNPAPIVEQQIVSHIIPNEKSQYHSQDSLGQAAYGHSEALQTHNAVQDAAGNKAGSYSYLAPDGRVLTTEYVADENGYRVATNALPVHHHRRRRSLLATSVASVPIVKEASFTHIPGHSTTSRLDTTHANVITAVPTVYAHPQAYYHPLSYSALPLANHVYVY